MAIDIWLKGAAIVLFAAAIFLYKLNDRKIHYDKVAIICLALVLIPLTSFLNGYLSYIMQLLLFAAFAHFGNEYYRRGFFRRRKELHELYKGARREHKEAKRVLYPHLRNLEERERKLERDLEKIEKVKADLKEHARQIKEERDELERTKQTVKEAHFEVLAAKEEQE